jgi:C-terminal processing protease CtpA/Prc
MTFRSGVLLLCASLAFASPATAQTPPPAPPQTATPMPARPAPLARPVSGLLNPTADLVDRMATPPFSETSGTLFENVVAMLSARYVDQKFRTEELPKIVEKYRERARESVTLAEQRAVVHDLLTHIPASHLGLLSKATHRGMLAELLRFALPTFGFQLVAGDGGYYAGMVLENGPAIRSGLLHGDRVVTVDGIAVEHSPRVDWRSDDAYIGDERDPAIRQLLAAAGDRVELRVERRPGEFVNVSIAAEEYSAFDAARASARVIRTGGKSVGYLHFWFVHLSGVPELLREKIDGEFAQVDALLIDLRGRGGSATEVVRIVALVREYMAKSGKPVVALVDRQSRSGKDILAYEFKESGVRLVGEASAGAVIPAMFGDVGHDSVLMFPTFRLPGYTDKLELQPVEPHVIVERPGMFAAGRDPILEAGVREAARLVADQQSPISNNPQSPIVNPQF